MCNLNSVCTKVYVMQGEVHLEPSAYQSLLRIDHRLNIEGAGQIFVKICLFHMEFHQFWKSLRDKWEITQIFKDIVRYLYQIVRKLAWFVKFLLNVN